MQKLCTLWYDLVELIGAISLHHLTLQLAGALQRPAIERDHLFDRHGVARRIEAGQVAEQEAHGVANPAIRIRHALQDLVRDDISLA
jgi:hypothetical protein